MDRRYSRSEKGKGQAPPELPAKRSPGTILAIGQNLGSCVVRNVKEAKIWVEVNGLQPLTMNMEIELPTEDVTEVEFEYIKIEKHCFTCFSLFHEEFDCIHRPLNAPPQKTGSSVSPKALLYNLLRQKKGGMTTCVAIEEQMILDHQSRRLGQVTRKLDEIDPMK
ncbi:hypothetical protein F2Q68_00002252 [Brassica cretica]|uniref:Zinc knuckle CX2CX4HX4C domain-containing protein n=2 Tax=Brassica cretica TaxID=69181 RepID=A0ABQ7CG81_BRACR|nr:hypothetical protein F2Q68_00002252 [Brassica cretica]KAF3550552.1 hypothetical protein DY000_02002982 [Brassica cretica]